MALRFILQLYEFAYIIAQMARHTLIFCLLIWGQGEIINQLYSFIGGSNMNRVLIAAVLTGSFFLVSPRLSVAATTDGCSGGLCTCAAMKSCSCKNDPSVCAKHVATKEITKTLDSKVIDPDSKEIVQKAGDVESSPPVPTPPQAAQSVERMAPGFGIEME